MNSFISCPYLQHGLQKKKKKFKIHMPPYYPRLNTKPEFRIKQTKNIITLKKWKMVRQTSHS